MENNSLHTKVRTWLASRFNPVCSVFSSHTVREILKKQGSISPSELLRPFGEVGNLNNISLQTSEKNQPFRLKNFRVDFVDAHKMDSASQPDSSWLIDFIIQNYAPKKFYEGLNSGFQPSNNLQKDLDYLQGQLYGLLQGQKNDTLTPWFSKWKRQFLSQTRFSDHEVTQQPIAFIYFISATEHDPLGTIDQLKRGENLPALYKEGVYDDSQQSTMSFVLILNPTNNAKTFQDAYDTVKQKIPSQHIYEIPMTKNNEDVQGNEDLWERFADLDEEIYMNENPMEFKMRGRSFSNVDRGHIKTVIKKMVEKFILPFIEKKIKVLETNVTNTRKGIKNQLKNLWKKTNERNENEGLKENFKMNKQELELLNLTNVAFVAQDYETALNNGSYPYKDFKNCKAFRHAASCQELLLLSTVGFDQNTFTVSGLKDVDQMIDNIYSLFQKSSKPNFLIRAVLIITELYDVIEKYQESANYFLKIANELKEQSVIIPLFLEQAAYKFLKMKQFRKFALYMIMAGKSYEKLNLQSYAFNCFTIVLPFYQRHRGWNGIRLQLYSTLGRNSQHLGDINLTVKFLRNLLQLCCEFDHMQEQKTCLNEFLLAVSNWNKQKDQNLIGLENDQEIQQQKTHIGQLNLPIVLEDSIEVFISSEKLYTNRSDSMINSLYFSYPTSSATMGDDNQEYQIQQKAEFNSTNCPWKFLAKHLFEYMNDEKRKQTDVSVQPDSCQFNGEEINEFAIYDCSNRAKKRDLTIKKIRKVFLNESVTVKLLMKNPLMADISINNIKLCCRYEGQEISTSEEIEQVQKNLTLKSLETKEIILEIRPKKTGVIIIERLEWVLFDVVSCAYQLVKPSARDSKLLTQEELIVSKKLLDREFNFKYEVLEQSGELFAQIKLLQNEQADQQQNFIFTEIQKCSLFIRNYSKVYSYKNGYIVCSHPMIFGFSKMRLFDKIDCSDQIEVELNLRASLMQSNEIKFLIRYEVENKSDQQQEEQKDLIQLQQEIQVHSTTSTSAIQKMSKYRFTRVLFTIESQFAFMLKKHVHLSTKKANEHIVNIQVVDNILPSSIYQTPQITSIEIVNKKKQWTLKKKDERGFFFIVMPFDNTNSEIIEQVSLLTYRFQHQVVSVTEDETQRNFLEQELQFVMNKFKLNQTNEEEEVDIIVQWQIPQLNKKGFYSLFKVPLLKFQKQLTEQQSKLQRQKSTVNQNQQQQQLQQTNNQQINGNKDGVAVLDTTTTNSKKNRIESTFSKINPLHVAYTYQRIVSHNFNNKQPLIVTFNLSISNMIQSHDIILNCVIEALNEWCPLNNPQDVSEGESFLWIGKTKHCVNNLKANVNYLQLMINQYNVQSIRTVQLKCSIARPGVYNLNRFKIIINDNGEGFSHFVKEHKIPDDILIRVLDEIEGINNNNVYMNNGNKQVQREEGEFINIGQSPKKSNSPEKFVNLFD